MEASLRILNPATLNRGLPHSGFFRQRFPPSTSSFLSKLALNATNGHSPAIIFLPNYIDNIRNRSVSLRVRSSSSTAFTSSFPSPNLNSLGLFLSLASSLVSDARISDECSERIVSDPKENAFVRNRAPEEVNTDFGFVRDRSPVFTVVLLGWLGAEQKHLKRYVELYNSRGIHALTFVVPVREALGFDLGKKVEQRVSALAQEIIHWLSEREEDGRERCLLFHTFSNTGWLAYGAILNQLQCKGNLIEKIKGCVVDSGGDPEINPKVWAAGFSTAILKKRSATTNPSVSVIEGQESENDNGLAKMQETKTPFHEMALLSVLEKFFSVLLKLPDVNRRLAEVISTLSTNQPPCPQLYLYSTADKVIPFQQVEAFIQSQKMLGRNVWSYNFGSSPHVDHYRKFPHIYSEVLHNFLKECVSVVCQM